MDESRKCELCKWFEPANRVWPSGCANRQVRNASPETARYYEEECGPSGRYWEPKDDA